MTTPTTQCLKRLQIELHKLQKERDLPFHVGADPQNMLRCYFVLDGPVGTPYEGGRYVGYLQLPPDYPFKPPAVHVCTPNGRFEMGKPICLSNSSFHPEMWSPLWGLRTILMAFLSFLTSEESAHGTIVTSDAERRELASKSRGFNISRLRIVYGRSLPDACAADAEFVGKGGSGEGGVSHGDHADTAAREEGTTGSALSVTPSLAAPVSVALAETPSASPESSRNYTAGSAAGADAPRLQQASKITSEDIPSSVKGMTQNATAKAGYRLAPCHAASVVLLVAFGIFFLGKLL